MVFDKEIALFNQKASTKEEATKILANHMIKLGIVKEDFHEAILEREQNFPTGLRLADGSGVAIPHTDIDKVNESQIAFMSLREPVKFIEMGTDDAEVEVSIIFMLALKEAHEQLDTLQNLMQLFCDVEQMKKFQKCSNKQEYITLIKEANLF